MTRQTPSPRASTRVGTGRAALGTIALVLISACTDSSPTAPEAEAPPAFEPELALLDGSTGGNPDFWWLPPTIPFWEHPYGNPEFDRDKFNPALLPLVDVCEDRDRDHSCDPGSGVTTLEANVQPFLRSYVASMRTNRRDRNNILLATARVGDTELGHVHVVVRLSNYEEGDQFVIPGLWAVFRFSIEEDALCIANDAGFEQGVDVCSSASFGGDGGDLTLNVGGTPTLSVKLPASGTPTTVTINNECTAAWPLALPELSDCFHVDESADIDFVSDPAIVCFLVGEANTADLAYHDEITLYQFTDSTAEALPREDCSQQQAALAAPGRLDRLAQAIGSFFGPQPLHAAPRRRLHLGGGGAVSNFRSDFLFSVPLAIERTDFDQGQATLTGETLGASVLVYFEDGETKMPYDGTDHPIQIDFSVTGGGGTAPTPVVVDDPTGIATTQWTLGSEPGLNTLLAEAGDGFGNTDDGGPFYSDTGVTDVVFGQGAVTFEATAFDFLAEQGDDVYGIAAYGNGETSLSSFYGYGTVSGATASANTGLEVEDQSILLMYRASDALSLIMIHDKAEPLVSGSPTAGGCVNFGFSGVPGGASFLVPDDPPPADTYTGLPPTAASWQWNDINTDGGALGDLSGGFDITITPDFVDNCALGGTAPGTISQWNLLSAGGGSTALSKTVPVRIRGN